MEGKGKADGRRVKRKGGGIGSGGEGGLGMEKRTHIWWDFGEDYKEIKRPRRILKGL